MKHRRLRFGTPLHAVILVLGAVVAAIQPSLVHAWTLLHPSKNYKWDSTYQYRINLASFQNNLNGLSLSAADAEFWVGYAVNSWRERAGLQSKFNASFIGTTTANNSSCSSIDGINQVYVVNGCRSGETAPCPTWAEVGLSPWPPTSSAITEGDVCIYGRSTGTNHACNAGWRVRMESFGAFHKDLVGVMVHEFGHVLGLAHTPYTVMSAPTFFTFDNDCGYTFARYPYGDDILGVRDLYGYSGIPAARFREMITTSWGLERSAQALDGVWHVLGDAGKRGSGQSVIMGN